MNLEKGKLYHGFYLKEETKVEELNSTAQLFYHEKSGARLLFLNNDDDNKVFSVTFKTPPADSTGVAHIVEHSVLCGSRKFPMKEPFVELVKGSLNTYLNAMTFPDKTMYPVASRNDKDFINLMDVYLDAVFYPNMYNEPEILMQEGWHYELADKKAELSYKGVVYNEMKGVFSSPDSILEQKIFETLYPDTTYSFESGGDPEVIPELTQEAFINFHKEYYHPANSYMFLYGKLDILEKLKFLDEEYLHNFDKIEVQSQIVQQQPFSKSIEQCFEYPIAPGENTQDKTFLSLNYVVGNATDAEKYLAFQILEYLLLETPAAPLKKALIDAGIGKDVVGSFVKSILQPMFGITVTGTNEEQKAKFVEIVNNELQRLVKEGIDKKLIEASINIFEFTMREADFGSRPKGLIYNIKCMDSWLYDDSPLLHLAYTSTLENIKTALTTNYFEKLIEEYLLSNKHKAVVILKPKQGLAEEKAQNLQKKLQEFKAELSDEELAEIIKQSEKLKLKQETEDSPEALATIPLLKLTDIEEQAEWTEIVKNRENNVEVLFNPSFTNGIAYVNLYFDTRTVPQEYLPYVYLLVEVLGKISTSNYAYQELSNEININTGGIIHDVAVYTENANDEIYQPKLLVKAKALAEKLPELFKLLEQILVHSHYMDDKRMQGLVQEIKSTWDMNMFRRGQQIAANRVLSYFSPSAQYNEIGMLSFYNFIADLEKNFAAKSKELYRNLESVAKLIFNSNNLVVCLTAEEKNYEHFKKSFAGFNNTLNKETLELHQYNFDFSHSNEGLMTSGNVQYVMKGANFCKLGYAYTGSLKVLDTILRYDYLWNRVRVQGGAYGGFAKFERSGNLVFGSYRDPHLKGTLQVYDETAAYLKNFNVTEREMTKYIIGTMSQVDTPLTMQQKGERATAYYFRKVSKDDIQKERDEILATKQSDIQKLADLVDAAMKENYLCVMGGEQKIRDNSEVFKEILNVFK